MSQHKIMQKTVGILTYYTSANIQGVIATMSNICFHFLLKITRENILESDGNIHGCKTFCLVNGLQTTITSFIQEYY